jgi:hypothetical protein
MGKPMGRHPILITDSQKPKKDPKVGRDPVISALSCVAPSTGYRSPKIGQLLHMKFSHLGTSP